MFQKYYRDSWKTNPFFHNASRSLEIMYAFERIPVLVNEFLKLEDESPKVEYTAQDGKGTGLVEAPRGLLIHHHEVTDGKVSYADIITPTAQNAADIERYGFVAAQALLDQGKGDEDIRKRLDMVVRAFDPCISCSAHMAKIRNAPEGDWQLRLAEVRDQGSPVYIGIGNPALGDDAAGIEMARTLKSQGVEDVWLESEIEENDGLGADADGRPFILLDAVDFQETPGKVTLLPMHIVLQNSSLSHKILPIVSEVLSPQQMRNAYLLGIQAGSLAEGERISPAVRQAMEKVLERLKN